jgi:hypothetical protein
LDTLAAIVVVGTDPTAAAQVALGAARAQAERRHVAIGDLVGEIDVLEALIPREDTHGLSDSFAYGISLNRVGYRAAPAGDLFIMPSGSESVATEAIIAHPRWQRLVAGFREVGALLVLVVQPGAPGLERLIPMTDGAILVDDTRLEAPSHVLARARPRGPRRALPAPTSPAANAAAVVLPASAAPSSFAATRLIAPSMQRRGLVVSGLLLLGVVAIGGILLLQGRRTDDVRTGEVIPAPAETPLALAPAADPPPPVENPNDSASASEYSIVLLAANTSVGASDNFTRVGDLPAATFAPSIENGAIWYKVFIGAYGERAQADSLRAALRQSGRAIEPLDQVVALPYALLVADALGADSARVMRDTLVRRGLPVYTLTQDDGTLRLYAGAFATPDEAMHLAPVLRSAGITPRIAYRTGRPQ